MNLLNTRSNELPGVKRKAKTQHHAELWDGSYLAEEMEMGSEVEMGSGYANYLGLLKKDRKNTLN